MGKIKEKKKIICFDMNGLSDKEIKTAYYRLTKEMVDFLKLCQKKHNIVGFEYDNESPFNFGIMLENK